MATVVAPERPKAKSKARQRKQSTPAKLTFEQAEELAAGKPFELINGRVVFKMPDDKHSDTQGLLCTEIGIYFKSNPIGRVRPEFTLRLWPNNPYEGRIPDLSIVLQEYLQKGERFGTRAPEIAIEIVSQDDKWIDLFEKAKLYLDKGSLQAWIVDPHQKGVMVITQHGRHWIEDSLTCPELLPGFSIKLEDIFA